jgi:hypothetical protein
MNMDRKHYMITVDEDSDPDTVAAQLKSHGLDVDNVMKEIRVISASTNNSDVSSVRDLRGVAAVEESGGFQIAPPDSPIQ